MILDWRKQANSEKYWLSDEAQKVVGTFTLENIEKTIQSAIREFARFLIDSDYKSECFYLGPISSRTKHTFSNVRMYCMILSLNICSLSLWMFILVPVERLWCKLSCRPGIHSAIAVWRALCTGGSADLMKIKICKKRYNTRTQTLHKFIQTTGRFPRGAFLFCALQPKRGVVSPTSHLSSWTEKKELRANDLYHLARNKVLLNSFDAVRLSKREDFWWMDRFRRKARNLI